MVLRDQSPAYIKDMLEVYSPAKELALILKFHGFTVLPLEVI